MITQIILSQTYREVMFLLTRTVGTLPHHLPPSTLCQIIFRLHLHFLALDAVIQPDKLVL